MYLSQECECICVHTGIGLLVWAELLPDQKLNQVSPPPPSLLAPTSDWTMITMITYDQFIMSLVVRFVPRMQMYLSQKYELLQGG